VLPNGNRLYYKDLHQEVEPDTELRRGGIKWVFKRADMPIHVYGAKLVENVVQALAFVHIMEAAKRVHQITQRLLFPAHQVHDELVYVVDEHLAEDVAELVTIEMSRPPEWMRDAPLAAEAHIGSSYGDLK
jgi:DNA polymerase I-like protein with 3'-5' exonuclease and polymerase domains